MFEPRVPVAPRFSVGERVSAGMTPEDVVELAPDAKVAAIQKQDLDLWAARNDIVTARGT